MHCMNIKAMLSQYVRSVQPQDFCFASKPKFVSYESTIKSSNITWTRCSPSHPGIREPTFAAKHLS
jgi:hypothetical protein